MSFKLVFGLLLALYFFSSALLPRISVAEPPSLPIIPGLHGFGTMTVAGSGRNLTPPKSAVFVISNLNSSGPHSLKECIEGRTPRTCIFSVGGEIQLPEALRIKSPFITIAGQTAPRPGITLTGSGIVVSTHDVLIQHISIRPGDGRKGHPPGERDGISIGAPPPRSAYNVVINHVSLTWAIDENLSTAYPTTHDVTISHSLIAEGLHRSIHPKGPHSKGVMVGDGSKRITLFQNLIAFNEERNPYLKPGSSTEFINNVVYGWGEKGGWSLCNTSAYENDAAPIELTFIGNTYKPAPSSVRVWPIYAQKPNPASEIYEHDTVATLADGRTTTSVFSTAARSPISSPGMHAESAAQSYTKVLSSSGARPSQRGQPERRIVSEVITGTGEIKDCLERCSRAAGPWVRPSMTRARLRVPRYPFQDSNKDGYTNLENWLHRKAVQVEESRRSPRR
jgi:hypothetical protein